MTIVRNRASFPRTVRDVVSQRGGYMMMPVVALAVGWFILGALAFYRAGRKARREGSLIRY
jgi:hypothetical protein